MLLLLLLCAPFTELGCRDASTGVRDSLSDLCAGWVALSSSCRVCRLMCCTFCCRLAGGRALLVPAAWHSPPATLIRPRTLGSSCWSQTYLMSPCSRAGVCRKCCLSVHAWRRALTTAGHHGSLALEVASFCQLFPGASDKCSRSFQAAALQGEESRRLSPCSFSCHRFITNCNCWHFLPAF